MKNYVTPLDSGYQILEGVLGINETSRLFQSLDAGDLTRSKAGARHLMTHPRVADIANDPRLLTIAREFLGHIAIPYRATLFDKSAARNWLVPWHQDTALPLQRQVDAPGWGPWSIKAGLTYAHAPASALSRVVALRLHFDDSTESNGPLRVIPATHTLGVLTDAEVGRLVDTASPVDCLVASAGIVAMRPLILHASSKSTSNDPRRVLHIEYVDCLDIEDGFRIAIA